MIQFPELTDVECSSRVGYVVREAVDQSLPQETFIG